MDNFRPSTLDRWPPRLLPLSVGTSLDRSIIARHTLAWGRQLDGGSAYFWPRGGVFWTPRGGTSHDLLSGERGLGGGIKAKMGTFLDDILLFWTKTSQPVGGGTVVNKLLVGITFLDVRWGLFPPLPPLPTYDARLLQSVAISTLCPWRTCTTTATPWRRSPTTATRGASSADRWVMRETTQLIF